MTIAVQLDPQAKKFLLYIPTTLDKRPETRIRPTPKPLSTSRLFCLMCKIQQRTRRR